MDHLRLRRLIADESGQSTYHPPVFLGVLALAIAYMGATVVRRRLDGVSSALRSMAVFATIVVAFAIVFGGYELLFNRTTSQEGTERRGPEE